MTQAQIQIEVLAYTQLTSLEQVPVSEGFEDCPGPDAKSLAITCLFKLLIKKDFSEALKNERFSRNRGCSRASGCGSENLKLKA